MREFNRIAVDVGGVGDLDFECVTKMDDILGADHSTSEGGGGGGWVILKKNILQVHMHKKKILAQDHRAKKKFMHVQWAGKQILARCSLS